MMISRRFPDSVLVTDHVADVAGHTFQTLFQRAEGHAREVRARGIDVLWVLDDGYVSTVEWLLAALLEERTGVMIVTRLPGVDIRSALGGRCGIVRDGAIESVTDYGCDLAVERGFLGVFTSGTTAQPRLVLHPFENLTPALARVATIGEPTGLRIASAFPMSSIGGLVAFLRCAMTGDSLVRWSLDEQDSWPFGQSGTCDIAAAPSVAAALIDRCPFLSPVLSLGGGPVPERALRSLSARTEVVVGYGMTETFGACSLASSGPGRPAEVGLGAPLTGVTFRIGGNPTDAVNDEVSLSIAPGIRAPLILGGDGQPPEPAWSGAWYETGDYVTCDDQGTLTYAGRGSGFLLRGGRAISIEAAAAVCRSVIPGADAVRVRGTHGAENLVIVHPGPVQPDRKRQLLRKLQDELGVTPRSFLTNAEFETFGSSGGLKLRTPLQP